MHVPLKGGAADHNPAVTSFLRVARNGDKHKLIDLIKENCDIINASNHVRIRPSVNLGTGIYFLHHPATDAMVVDVYFFFCCLYFHF